MPIYEYRCEACDSVFEKRSDFAHASDPAVCPAGHKGSRRIVSLFSAVRSSAAQPAPAAMGCGAGCACAAAGSPAMDCRV